MHERTSEGSAHDRDPRVLDEERLRRLIRELDDVARQHVPWYDSNALDPGIALLELLAYAADSLAHYQTQIADEAYLQTQPTLGASRVAVTIDGSPWRDVPSLEKSGPGDAVYVADRDVDGSVTVRFGDGQHGRRPPTGAVVVATYRRGAHGARALVTIRWPPQPALALEVHANSALIRFARPRQSWRDCLSSWFGGRG